MAAPCPPPLLLPDELGEEFLLCRLCRHHFDTPKILPCLHTFCASCLSAHVQRSTTSGASLWFLCPACRAITDLPPTGTSAFKTNQFVANLRRFTDSLGERYSRLGDDLPRGKEEEEEASEEIKRDRGPPPKPGGCLCEKEAVSFYCSECELLSCPSCVTTRHKSHSVGLLEDKANKERDRVTATAHQARKEVSELNIGIADLEKYKVTLRTARNEAQAGVRAQAARLRKLIDQQEDALLKEVEDAFTAETGRTDKVIRDNRDVAVILKNLTDFSDRLLRDGADAQLVVWSAHAHSQLRSMARQGRKYGVERVRRRPLQLEFTPGTEQDQEDEVKQLVGQVHCGVQVDLVDCNMNEDRERRDTQRPDDGDTPIVANRVHTGRLVRSFSAFTDGSHFSPTVVGLAVTPSGDVLVVDRNNKCVKFFGPAGGMYRKLHGSDSLWGVAVLPDGTYAVTDRTVHIFDTRGRLQRVLRQQPRDAHGVAVNSTGDVLVADCLSRCIYVLSLLGGSIRRVITQRGREPFSCPANLCVTPKDQLVVADCGAHVVAIFSEQGQLIAQYGTPNKPGSGPGQLDCPSGVCADRRGHVLVCDKLNDRVLLLDPADDANLIAVLVEGAEVIRRPQAVAVDHNGHMVVAEEEGMIKVFQYREVV